MWNRQLAPRLSIVLIVLGFASSSSAAPSAELGAPMRAAEARAGTLLLQSESGLRPAPTVATDVHIQVTGMIARTRVVQRFHNPTSEWVEGIYVFPLPDRAAVDGLKMIVGDRVLEGEIHTREEAKAQYERARSEGRKATLLEQERPNLFTNAVANLGPNEVVEVAIEFQEDLRLDRGNFSLRFPLVVGPRYVPGVAIAGGFDGHGWARNTDEVPDAERVTPPIADPDGPRRHPARIHVALDPGFALSRVDSPSHRLAVSPQAGNRFEIDLADGFVPADRDFVLEWTPEIGASPGAALFHESWDGDDYVLLMVMPPDASTEIERLPRETVFVIDVSGSMHGDSITQAKHALALAIGRLRPQDRFNVIAFESSTRVWSETSRSATSAALADALRWIEALRADGGTEMQSALEAALPVEQGEGSLRQVVFITDGAVSNEANLFRTIRARLGQSRLFTVGIGSAPNAHFMRKAAEFGRGTYTFIGTASEVANKMGELFAKLESPVLQDLRVSWDARAVETWPKRLPDLYAGEPILIAARMSKKAGAVVLSGRRGDEDIVLDVPVQGGALHPGIARLWARRKVEALMSSLHDGADRAEVKHAVTGLGLRHHLVTRWTSLVAVDNTPTRPDGEALSTRAIPTLLPAGWDLGSLGAPGPRPPRQHPPIPSRAEGAAPPVQMLAARLPQGATPAPLLILLGIVLVASGTVLRHFSRRAR